ncbi:CsgG/HfaB family protein [Erythrobacter sp. SD-21]|uniref:CsgG/HfaB family protein n=1 Tax=Erythrobacter sp. SD-21 TaxID=161528 RepID=UPI000153F878|nr:CsgG/HfaB family protein [Erythrobacter sp. SD-21]EDL49083.1 Curli production assembly/transport component CsgG [Erythrobacter sp. SD-21]
MLDFRVAAAAIAAPLAMIAPTAVAQEVSASQQVAASGDEIVLKRRVAIGRFTNETRYGQTLLRDSDLDPLGKQAADIMAAYLIDSNAFIVVERTDANEVLKEQGVGGETSGLIGADTIIVGSIVEFGRADEGERAVFKRERTQKAYAKVAIRLVDVRTGVAFHSATGSGEATTTTKTKLFSGTTARYDGTLTDKALSVAIEDVLEDLINSLSAREWRTDILAVEGGEVFIAGGETQGLRPGDTLVVKQRGRSIKSRQTGSTIELPAATVARLTVDSTFGSGELNEGSVTRVTSGSIDGIPLGELFVSVES